jgi:hypothetical protein
MFRKVLRLTIERGTSRSDDLARDLNISPELLRLVLEELVRRDYLRALVPGCSAGCGCCPLRTACLYRSRPRVWMLTGKSDMLLAKSDVSARTSEL